MSSTQALRVRVLVRASELCGGRDVLAKYLSVGVTKLDLMLEGRATVSEVIFLKAVDLLAARQITGLSAKSEENDRVSS